ncbi:MAG: DHH family phosphoesterase [Candidatus Methanomethylophilaceae archaeon]|nr:DHH family phosphoesterase [Candidatus Methanomethylophilaceae archaeon]
MMLTTIAEKLKDKNKVILVHGNADMDALGSAYAVSNCFPPATIYAPGGMDRVAKMVAEKLGISILDECDISNYELVVVVDTSSPEQFKPGFVDVPENSIVIDHHLPTGKWENMQFYCDNTKVSCCEIIKEMIDDCHIEISKNVGLALLGGMLTDSGHFQFANPEMLRAFAEILENKSIGMDEAMNLTRSSMSMSERIAVMKTIERTKYDRVGDMIVAVATGSSFEASACRAITSSGADVVFVCTQRDDEFRLSARATQEMVRRGIHLGTILGIISEETDTDGGGHGGAAGLSGIGDAEAMLHMCQNRTMDEFRKIKVSMTPQDAADSEE